MGKRAVKVQLMVVVCLVIVFQGITYTAWYVRRPRVSDGRMGVVNHIHTPNTGFARVQEATIEKTDPAITTETSKLGYLVILNIPEQLTSAVEHFVQLYMINTLHWKLGMIEPYVRGTWLAFLPSVKDDFRSLPLLSTYFNRSHMIHNLKQCFHSDVQLNTFEDFLINAARPFIVLKFVAGGPDISECPSSMNKTEYRLNYHLQRVKDKAVAVHGLNHSFIGVKSLCIRSKPQSPFSMLRVVEYVKQWMMNTSGQISRPFTPQHTVVIPEWNGIRNQPSGHFYYDPTFTALNVSDSCQMRSVPYSSFVTNAASRVLDTLALPRPLIAFHIRSEKIAGMETKNYVKGFVDKCMALLPRVFQAVQNKYNVSRDHIIFTYDGTEYGSTSMNGFHSKPLAIQIISKVKALGIRNVQYKPLNDTRADFAAPQFVEQEILMSADVLIIVGYGSFQKTLLTRFRDKVNGRDKWYQMCSSRFKEDHLEGLDM